MQISVHTPILFLLCYFLQSTALLQAQKPDLQLNKQSLVFSAIMGTPSKADTLLLSLPEGNLQIGKAYLTGEHAAQFRMYVPEIGRISKDNPLNIALWFEPEDGFAGLAKAILKVDAPSGKELASANLTGLSTKALEGKNEAPLSLIVEALGYQMNPGWKELAHHTKAIPQGDELAPSLFQKAGAGAVEIRPVARYSPPFHLPFGYYTPSAEGPELHQIGILNDSRDYPEHQTLFPSIASGNTSFDPGDNTFGFYTASPTHIAYSEDIWNILFYEENTAHAMRAYPVTAEHGKVLENAYLLCFEEASNGDYQDYVFLVQNVRPVPIETKFVSLLNDNDLEGWYTFLQSKGKNNDPENIFTVKDGELHDIGKELGYVSTEKHYTNFHFKLEFRWGEKKWPPRDTSKRDSGICYHIPDGEPDQIWPRSIECQIQEGDVGDFWLLGYSTILVDGKQNVPLRHSRIVKKQDAEKAHGEWNTVEVISFNGQCVHIVNGVVANAGQHASLRKGRILLQSEYAEIYYRNVSIREL